MKKLKRRITLKKMKSIATRHNACVDRVSAGVFVVSYCYCYTTRSIFNELKLNGYNAHFNGYKTISIF